MRSASRSYNDSGGLRSSPDRTADTKLVRRQMGTPGLVLRGRQAGNSPTSVETEPDQEVLAGPGSLSDAWLARRAPIRI